MTKKTRQAILVLGMHRSGTSALAGALGLLGMRLPSRLMPPTIDNPKGYFESVQIYEIHERLLAAAGTNWFGIESLPADWFHSAQASAFVDELVAAVRKDYGDAATFVVKDPRMCRLMPLWRKVLDEVGAQARFAIPLRNPLEVARSLEKRDGLPLAHGCLLWLRHVLDAERETRGSRRVFVHYHDLLSDPARMAALIASQLTEETLALNARDERDISSLIDSELRHHVAEPEQLHRPEAFYPWLWDAYEASCALVDRPTGKGPQRRLDRVRMLFEPAAASFAPLLAARESALAERDAKISALDRTLVEREAKVATLDQALSKGDQELGAIRNALSERDAKSSALDQTLVVRKAEVAALDQALAERDRDLGGLRDALAERDASIAVRDQTLVERKVEVAALDQALAERDRDLGGLRDALAARDVSIAARDKTLAEREAKVATLDRALAERDRKLGGLRDALAARDKSIAARDKTLAEREAKVATLDRALAERDRELGGFRDALAARDASIAARDKTLAEREAKLATLNQMFAKRRHEIGGLQAALAEREATVTALQSTISALRSSTSWRVTTPLRWTRRLLGRIAYSAAGYPMLLGWRAVRMRSLAPLREWGAVRVITRSGLFDREWYLKANPDVAAQGIDPIRHYVAFGAKEGCDPGPTFNTRDYLLQNRDVAEAGVNPLAHLVMHGAVEGRAGGVFPLNVGEPNTNIQLTADAHHRGDPRPAIVMVLHQSGGGTEKHVRKLAAKLATRARFLLLKVGPRLDFTLSIPTTEDRLNVQLRTNNLAEVRAFLRSFGVQRVHVHHTFGFFDDAQSLLRHIGLPYDLTVHDFMLICPRLFLYREGPGYCGEPDEFGCTHCLRQNPPGLSTDILWWRWTGRELIEGAERVICPSQDTAARIARYAPDANLLVIPHEDPTLFEHRKVRVPELSPGQPMRVVVLGVMTGHKGIYFLLECISAWSQADLNINVTLIGESLLPDAVKHMHVTGPYEETDLPGLIADADPHLIFYPQKCPETYSYTLSEGLMAGVPLFAPDLGSFRERIEGRAWCWLYDPTNGPDLLADLMHRIRIEHVQPKNPPAVLAREASTSAFEGSHAFYDDDYIVEARSVGLPF